MSRVLVAAAVCAALVGFALPVSAQQFAAESAVVSTCTTVAMAESSDDGADNALRGQCIAATLAYINDIGGRGLGAGEFDQAIADLVVVLAEIMFTPRCTVESEVAQAIALANASTNDVEQQAQIRLVYETVNACDFVVTAAIFTPNAQSLVGESGSPFQPLASQN